MKTRHRARACALVLALLAGLPLAAQPAHAAPAKPPPLSTPWTSQALVGTPLPEYPRPQMIRPDWLNLNGEWQLRQSATDGAPQFGVTLPERVNVPFAVESALSGVMRPAGDDRHYLFYRRTFTVPPAWQGRRVQLHFGAVDWEASVWVNGRAMGSHRGGYDRFEFDITDALDGGTNELIVKVYDPTDSGHNGSHPVIGKQTRDPSAIFYTPVSGIWQTVWLEPTPPSSISSVDTYPSLSDNTLRVRVFTRGNVSGHSVLAEALDGTTVVGTATGAFTEFRVPVPNARRWTPDDPFLYDLRISLRDGAGRTVDRTTHYFGMREVGKRLVNGVLRPTLNGEFVYHLGTLDQGYWPDGLYTAPTDAALAFDLQKHKELGFTMVRKHIKVEPQRWYYHADRLGLLVWQDIPSMQASNRNITPAHAQQFETEAREIVDEHRSSPAVVAYVPFNEGWGEWNLADTRRVIQNVKNQDPTRLVNGHSGFNCCNSLGDPGNGDMIDWHVYTGPDAPAPSSTRVSILGEFGGLGLRTPGHEYSPHGGFFAYEHLTSGAQLGDRYTGMVRDLRELVTKKGLSGSVYTEITDLEGEYNGLMTYDRRVQKVDTNQVRAAHRDLLAAAANENATPRLTAGHVRSFRVTTPGHTGRYLRHADSVARTDVITTTSPDLARRDASFRAVPGLADARCHSFESVNLPGRYLRHANSVVRLDASTGGSFASDATWCARPGRTGTGASFESLNFPGAFLRHHSDNVYLARPSGPNPFDGGAAFDADATWDVSAPALWRSSADLPVDARRSLQVRTWGFTDRYLRHADSLASTAVVNSGSGALLKNDATWTIRRGLADSSCYAFESVNYPGRFLRHASSRVRMDANDGSALFAQDATWCARPGLQGDGVTLESINYPGSYLRHYQAEVWSANGTGTAWNRPQTLTADSTWQLAAPWAP
ncbi:AbfB domain-containing protein [Nonomuraea ferruginea]|uniref:AbfB domain-containing protein n=1 Tax=Nonomuraea ferruginea TaxID=46174 RepID=A0ABT4SVI6_9ACTN|nr:AbfB domain-containing protein [Nonomuraea ferruginea]MDA0641271.1 AbfB domain-containing protein [Nonomuraea ferruginea]